MASWSSVYRPVLIRQGDMHLTHAERAGIAKRAWCKAVVEIHFNFSSDPTMDGGQLFYRRDDKAGRALGVEIMSRTGRDYGTWASDFRYKGDIAFPGVLAITEAYADKGISCALVELAFLSCAGDIQWLKRPGAIDKLALAIYSGCEAWARGEGGDGV